MRLFLLLSTSLSLFFAAASVAVDQTEIIGNQDKRIVYTNGWHLVPFSNAHGGTLAVTQQASDIATLTVNNVTSVAVTVFVETPGEMVRISLDNQTYDISPSLSQQPAWTSDALDPSVPHTIRVIKLSPQRTLTSLDSFLVTHPGSPADTTLKQPTISADVVAGANTTSTFEPTSSPQSAADDQRSSTEPVLSGGKLAAVIVACIIVLALIIGGLLYRQRKVRKRKAASSEYWEWISNRPRVPLGQAPPPFTPSDKFDGTETRESI